MGEVEQRKEWRKKRNHKSRKKDERKWRMQKGRENTRMQRIRKKVQAKKGKKTDQRLKTIQEERITNSPSKKRRANNRIIDEQWQK